MNRLTIIIFILISMVKVNAQFHFEYNGPDTLFLNNDCNAVLNWGHPYTPTAVSTIGNTITTFEIFSISGGHHINDVLTGVENIEIVYKAIDNQSNSAFFNFNIAVVDKVVPVIDLFPLNKAFTCELPEDSIINRLRRWYNNHGYLVAHDNCSSVVYSANKTLQQVETEFNQSVNIYCGNTRFVNVTYSVSDQYGNNYPNNFTSSFSTYDHTDPTLTKEPSNLSLVCNETTDSLLEAWIDDKGGARATDNCTAPENIIWSVSWKRITGSGSGLEDIGNKPYVLKPNHSCKDSINVNFIYEDECNNDHASFLKTISIIDNQPPAFSALPVDTVIDCSALIPRPQISAYDACKGFLTVQFTETSTKTGTVDSCTYYNYLITQSWAADDGCGHPIFHSRKITVHDNTPPTFTTPADISIGCTDYQNLTLTGQPTQVLDNCTSLPIVSYNDIKFGEGCQYKILRRWVVSDICNNSKIDTQVITIIDTIYPQTVKAPVDLFLKCDTSIVFKDAFTNWINTKGGAQMIDNCNKVYSFAAIPGSYTPGNSSSFPGHLPVFDLGDTLSCSNDTLIFYKDVDFVFYDNCFNTVHFTRRFAIYDNQKPLIVTCASDTIISLDLDQCSKEVTFKLPTGIDNCTGETIEINKYITKQITSAVQGSYTIPVDPVTINIGPFAQSEKNPIALTDFNLHFERLDADDINEYFYVVGENNDTLTITPRTERQCDTFDLQLLDFVNLDLLSSWLSDGYITIKLLPNIPPGDGIYAINDICSGSTVTTNIKYLRSNPNDLNYFIKIDDKDFISVDKNIPINQTLAKGDHLVTYKISDCGNNTAECHNHIKIVDNQKPTIVCPQNISYNLPLDSCNFTLPFPLTMTVTDNCSDQYSKKVFVPTDTSKAYLSFTYNSYLEQYIANSKIYDFENLPKDVVLYSPILKIIVTGDIDESDEYFDIINENGQIIGNTSNANNYTVPGNCSSPQITTISLSPESLRLWLSDNKVSFAARPAATSNPINPCDPATVNNDGDIDSTSKILMTIEFQEVLLSYLASGATNADTTNINFQDDYKIKLNSGETQLTYIVNDGSGNKDQCSFDINIIDNQYPIAKCKNYFVLDVNPGGTSNTILHPQSLNDESYDNCGIDSMSVYPNEFDCTQDNSNVMVTLKVWDNFGNVDSCSTNILVKIPDLVPSFSSGVCLHDTLRLFANLPDAPDNVWTISWTGPNGFVSNVKNPIRPNADLSFSGTYVLTATGFNGCFASGAVEVNIEDLSKPTINSTSSTVCAEDIIHLETNVYSGNVKYHWYLGTYPNGVLIDSTLTPSINIKPNIGSNLYYVIAKSPYCESLPSGSVTINAVSRPVANVDTHFYGLCEGETLTLHSNPIGNISTYHWWGPNGFESFIQNPVSLPNISIVNQGTYYFVVNNSYCSDTSTIELVVFHKPIAPVISGDTVVCKNSPIVLKINNIPNADNYRWYHNGVLYISQSSNSLIIPQARPQFEGEWKAIAKEGSCNSDTSLAFNVKIEEEYSVFASNTGPVCEGDTVRLFSSPITNATYSWIGPDGFVSTEQNPAIIGKRSGEYMLSIITKAGCVYNISTTLVVKPKPQITALSSDAPQCLTGNDCVSFFPTVYPFENQFAYNWSGPNEFNSSLPNPVICNFSSFNTGKYNLVVSDGFCKSDTSSIVIFANVRPEKPELQDEIKLCQNDTLKINILNPMFGSNALYHWSKAPAGSQFLTNDPVLVIPSSSFSNSGSYSVIVEKDGCFSLSSDSLKVTIIQNPNKPYITGTQSVCAGDDIDLNTSFVNGGVYHWSGPLGYTSDVQNPKIYPSEVSDAGIYRLYVTIDGCKSEISEGFKVDVLKVPNTPIVILNDTSYCITKEVNKLSLCISNIEANTNYQWFLNSNPPKLLGEIMDDCLEITNFDQLKDGSNYVYVIASNGLCKSDNSNAGKLNISKTPDRKANAGDDKLVCFPDNILLNATLDPEGKWRTLNTSAIIENPNKGVTYVHDLQYGENMFIWSLTHGSCTDFASDTVNVFLEVEPVANDDNYTTDYNNTLLLNPILNDKNYDECTLNISSIDPKYGNLIRNSDNTFSFVPNPAFIGKFNLQYKLQNMNCPDNVDEALITIEVGNIDNCFGANVITPNGDGINDILIFPCLSSGGYQQNELIVFNQWGTQVYNKVNYQNDWAGTYNNKDLPVGTYYYILYLDNDKKNTVTGFVVIER